MEALGQDMPFKVLPPKSLIQWHQIMTPTKDDHIDEDKDSMTSSLPKKLQQLVTELFPHDFSEDILTSCSYHSQRMSSLCCDTDPSQAPFPTD